MMKTDNLAHSIRKSEHLTTMKTFLRSTQWSLLERCILGYPWRYDNFALIVRGVTTILHAITRVLKQISEL